MELFILGLIMPYTCTNNLMLWSFLTQIPSWPLPSWPCCELLRERRSRSSKEWLHSGRALVISWNSIQGVQNCRWSKLNILPTPWVAAVPCSNTGSMEMESPHAHGASSLNYSTIWTRKCWLKRFKMHSQHQQSEFFTCVCVCVCVCVCIVCTCTQTVTFYSHSLPTCTHLKLPYSRKFLLDKNFA